MTVDTQSTDQSVAQQLTTTTYDLFTPCSRLHHKPQLLWNLRWRNGLNLELFLGYVWAWTMRTIRYQGYKQQLSFFKVTIKFNQFSLRVRSWQTYSREWHNSRVTLSTAIFSTVVIFPANDVILARSDTFFCFESNNSITRNENIFHAQ